jgi:hypothetical protein
MLLEAKTAALCPSNYGTRFAANGDTWMEARARKAVVERDVAAKKLDHVVFPNVQPPPMAMQLQSLGGVSAIVVGAFCEHNDQVHSLVNLLAVKAGPGPRWRLASTTNPRWLLRRTASGCGWQLGHGAIITGLFTRACPSSTPTPPTPLSKRTYGALTNAKSARRATPSSPSPFWCARGGGRVPPRTTRAAFRKPQAAREFLLPRAAVA